MKEWSTLRKLMLQRANSGVPINEYTATGNPVKFETNVVKPLKSLVIPWTPTQSGTGDPSPENVRPISGMDGVTVWHSGKNIANVVGYSAESVADGLPGSTTNTYGTTINTTSPSNAVVVTQSSSTTDYAKTSYRNGFVIIRLDPIIKFNKTYDFSFKITNIVSNPLDATLSDIQVLCPNGATLTKNDFETKGDTLIFRNALYTPHSSGKRTTVEIRICGMSCTISDFMITAPNTSDGEYEPYTGQTYPVTFPALGKNLLDITNTDKVAPGASGSTITISNGVISIDAVATSARSYVTFAQEFSAGTYTIQAKNTGAVALPRLLCDTEFDGSSYSSYYKLYAKSFGANHYLTFTLTEKSKIGLVLTNVTGEAESPGTLYDIQLEASSSDTSYEPYTNTVYGGSLDVTTGVLTVTHKTLTLTGEEGYNYTIYNESIYTADQILTDSKSGTAISGICSMVITSESGRIGNSYLAKSYSDRGLQFYRTITYWGLEETTVEALTTKLHDWYEAGTPLQICYELAEPQEIQLSTTQITALLGDNTIWSDTNGTNTAVYLKKG